MKKAVALLLIIALLLCGCTANNNNNKLSVVASIYPIYDWVKNLTEETDIDVQLVADNGSDIHSFQPSVSDSAKLFGSGLFIFVGGESDEWAYTALQSGSKNGSESLSLFDVLKEKLLTEEYTEGMEKEEEEEEELDEHVWLSVENALVCVTEIAKKLCELSPENADKISSNKEAYENELKELKERETKAAEKLNGKTAVFADRFPFRYFADELGIEYYAPFAGCSAETEASFRTVAFLKNKVQELNSASVFVLTGNNEKLAKTIAPDAEIVALNSIETKNDKSYIEIMDENIDLLLKGLTK